MRRRPGVLLPIEISILETAVSALTSADGWLHGYALAKQMADARNSGRLTAHGTLYKALGRLADSGMLESAWEDAELALAEGRPRRRLYRITGLGQKTFHEQTASAAATTAAAVQLGIAPS